MLLTHYPTLTKAFDLMLVDNVGDYRIIKKIREKVHAESLEPVGVFDRAEADLSKLSEDDLDWVCCGEQDAPDFPKISADSEEILNALFEMIS